MDGEQLAYNGDNEDDDREGLWDNVVEYDEYLTSLSPTQPLTITPLCRSSTLISISSRSKFSRPSG